MNKPDGITQDAWDKGCQEAQFYADWLHAGNSTGELSEHAIEGLADSFARVIQFAVEAERENAVKVADYALDEYGRLSFVQTEGWIGLRKVVAERIRKGT